MKAVFSIGLFIMTVLGVQNITGQEIEKLIPSLAELEGWRMNDEPQVFVGDDLYNLIDGGADLYLEYGFNRVVSAYYTDPSLNNIQVEIYEMVDAPSAYGIFSLTQQTVDWSGLYGNLSAVKKDYISFWKSKYYVNLSWLSRQHLVEPILANLADLIGQKIPDEGNYPDLLQTFQSIDSGNGAIFLKGNLALSNFYYFDYRDIFRIQEALAFSSDSYKRIFIKYADQPEAVEILNDARQKMSNNKRFADVTLAFQGFGCKDNKGNLILIRQIENYIVVLVALDNSISLEPVMNEINRIIESNSR